MTVEAAHRTNLRPEVREMYDELFAGALDAGDELAVYRELARRIGVVSAALNVATDQRSVLVAWWWAVGQNPAAIAKRIGDLSVSRVSQLIARGRTLAGLTRQEVQA